MTHHPTPYFEWNKILMTCTKNLCFSMWMYTVTFNSLLSTPSHTCACISMLLVVHSSHIRTRTRTPDLNTVNIRIQVDIPKLVYFMNMKVFFSWSWERMIQTTKIVTCQIMTTTATCWEHRLRISKIIICGRLSAWHMTEENNFDCH